MIAAINLVTASLEHLARPLTVSVSKADNSGND